VSRLASVFARSRAERRAAFIAYLTAGDPSVDETVALARALDAAGADVLELGVPFSDPIADGPVIQRATSRALAGGTTLDSVLDAARRIRAETDLALVLFSYVNPLMRYGFSRAAGAARDAGCDGILLTDVPPEEAPGVTPHFVRAGLDTIFLASPTSDRARMRAAARLSRGFLYVVSRPGTTGARAALPPDLAKTVNRAREAADGLPIAVGFGIGTPDVARRAARLADGVVVGSALVAAAESAAPGRRTAAVGDLAARLIRACRWGARTGGRAGEVRARTGGRAGETESV
jgi:tryptophan synthase alpha chain